LMFRYKFLTFVTVLNLLRRLFSNVRGPLFSYQTPISMKGIDKLPYLTITHKKDLLHSAEQYKQFARVEF